MPFGGKDRGLMLAITGTMQVWFMPNITDMRMGHHKLLEIVETKFPDPYNGDLYVFMSKDRKKMKLVRYEDHMYILYVLSYDQGYKFMQPVYSSEGKAIRYKLDYKYLVALLKCPAINKLHIAV
jgi:hypothetical protein